MNLRIVFFGSECIFSQIILESLIDADACLVAIWLAGAGLTHTNADAAIEELPPPKRTADDPLSLPLISPFMGRTLVHLAWEHAIPLYVVHRTADPETVTVLKELAPDLGCAACFPRRAPASWLATPRHGILNVHPSLLPHYRGPAPLFWQFRAGEQSTGVTIHKMDLEFDTGPIAAQQGLALAEGIEEDAANTLLAKAGAELLAPVVRKMARAAVNYRPQPAGGSAQAWPRPEDFRISTTWAARRVFNFMRGTVAWGRPYPLDVSGETILLAEALDYCVQPREQSPLRWSGDTVEFQCTPGAVRARLWTP